MAAVWRQTSSCLRWHRTPPTQLASWAASTASRHVSRPRFMSSAAATTSPLRGILRISEEVEAALATNQPVVALESTIYTHGALGMDLRLEAIVRENGGVPAVIGVLDGVPRVGLSPDEVNRMVEEGAQKVSRRDLAVMSARGHQRGRHGGTTISGTMVLARLAGIRVFGTGGLGGVHRGWHDHMDISADLSELGRTRVAVVSSGCKGFLDIAATLEYLETQGVYVGTFADGRPANEVAFPAFWARESGIPSPSVVGDEAEAAAIVWAQEQLGVETGLLFANAIPHVSEVPRLEMEAVIDRVVNEAAAGGYTGNRNTPFVLRRIRELTDQRTVSANVALVQANVARAAKVAVHLSALVAGGEDSPSYTSYPVTSSPKAAQTQSPAPETTPSGRVDVLVAGSVALDLSCDYIDDGLGGESSDPAPRLHTSNPASIVPTVGGVGHNVALAAHAIGSPQGVRVRLCSLVGEDIAGATVLAAMAANGLDTDGVRQLDVATYSAARTAHYVAINGADKNLMVAMADMAIFSNEQHNFSTYWASAVAAAQPSWLVADANWSASGLHGWIRAARQQGGVQVAFEPVSVAKSSRLFEVTDADKSNDRASHVFPRPLVDLATPNQYELAAMHAAAQRHGFVLDDPHWFRVIDALGLGAGARERFVRLTSFALTDEGVPQQAVQLLPYIPTLLTKLGSRGVLFAKLLHRDDPLLHDRAAEPYLLVRAPPFVPGQDHNDTEPAVGGIYMRLFPAVEDVPVHDVVSVNGVGDTFLGALVAGLAQGGRAEQLVDVAQQAAVLTLRSRQSVGGGLASLAGALTAAAKTAV
ncbi:IdgA domain protein [Sporothrix schenckii 1099-18]|uniref:IdgA domain protein n=1 Tax=Sporothrix schenckii 1099-18 TaxID=1397361 RepID=A0A0F2MLA3_SPOSC|nr:IdgA domain protein [Sporothrix schenckii 1099-18]KJR89849.1 IdgA domain protein [Sporothrix schenckii 1099-18]